jgi:hypothetical protein
MGYTTYFYGEFILSRPLTAIELYFLKTFNRMRHTKLHLDKLKSNWILDKLNLAPTKENEGQYYILAPPEPILRTSSDYFLFDNPSQTIITTLLCIKNRLYRNIDKAIFFKILSYALEDRFLENRLIPTEFDFDKTLSKQQNNPPGDQPGLYCGWMPNENGTAIIWDEAEKFYEYVNWMHYLIDHFFIPWGITLNGEMDFFGEDKDDRGNITIVDNVIDINYSDDYSSSDDEE